MAANDGGSGVGDADRVARLLENLRRAGVWLITSYEGHEELCRLLAIDPGGPFVRDLFAERLKAKVDGMDDGDKRRRVGLLLGVAPGMRGRSPHDLMDVVKETFNERTGTESGSRAFGRANLAARAALARKLLSDPSPLLWTESRHVGIAYVPRPALEAEIDGPLSSGPRIISLIGDSGNGKSRLAHEVLLRHCAATGSVLIRLNASDGESLFESGRTQCAGFFPDIMNPSLASLRDALQQRKIGCALLLDDATDWEAVRNTVNVPPGPIVLTSDREIVPSEVPHATVIVDPMEDEAARALVGRFLADVEAPEIDRFLGATARKPRAIIDCLSIFSEAGLSLGDLCDQLEQQPRMILRSLSRSERSLAHAYDVFLRQLDSDDPHAALLLRIIANLGTSFIYTPVLGDVFDLALERGPQSPPQGEFERCVYVLLTRLHFDWDRHPRPRRDQVAVLEGAFAGSIHLNELTYGILEELTADFAEECFGLADAAFNRANEPKALDWLPGLIYTANFFFWRAHASEGVLLSDGCVAEAPPGYRRQRRRGWPFPPGNASGLADQAQATPSA
jgi:hypothetical protein